MKDWLGNKKTTYLTLGASNHTDAEREVNDYYATEPKATQLLCDIEKFDSIIWEPACGGGHMSEVLKQNGYNVWSTDLINRGYGEDFFDFLTCNIKWNGDIITNPPYRYAQKFIEHSLDLINPGNKVAMFLRLQFLEGNARGKMYAKNPPKTIWVSRGRLGCPMNGDMSRKCMATAFAWFIWEKGYKGDTIIKWFN